MDNVIEFLSLMEQNTECSSCPLLDTNLVQFRPHDFLARCAITDTY